MFERSLRTREEQQREAVEGRTADEIASIRLAAYILVLNAILAAIAAFVAHDEHPPMLQMFVAFAVGYYLYKLSPRAQNLAVGLSFLAAIAGPILLFARGPVVVAILQTLAVWGVAGPMMILLLGTQTRVRRAIALALFLVLTSGVYGVIFLAAALT